MLPKINSTRKKIIEVNGKKVEMFPWTNMQLFNYETQLENISKNKIDFIIETLVDNNIKSKSKLTLVEKRYLLAELFILSKGKYLDINFICTECEKQTPYLLDIKKALKFNELKNRIISINEGEITFNLKRNSSYMIDFNKDESTELLKYLVSFIDSFIYEKKVYEVTDINEVAEWFNTELPNEYFEKFILEMKKNVPSLEIKATAICANCSSSNKLNIKLEDFL